MLNLDQSNINKYYDYDAYKTRKFYQDIMKDNSPIKIWKNLDNGCSIGTIQYSEDNVSILEDLLQSFSEQYGEVIDTNAAREELLLYQNRGKCFIYFNEEGKPISMNGVIYNEDNISVDFLKSNGETPKSLYFYGLSTLKEHRGKGACRELIKFAINYAYYNHFDLVYARTDLVNSNSEWLMANAGLEVCTYDDSIIAEWVDVTEDKGDYRLHMWLPFHDDVVLFPKDDAVFADISTRQIDQDYQSCKTYQMN